MKSGDDAAPAKSHRLTGMPNLQVGMIACMACKCCRRHTLVNSAKHEIKHGLYSVLGLWCTWCRKVTHRVPLTDLLRAGRRGPDLAAVHVRAQMGMAEAGMDRASANRYHAGLDFCLQCRVAFAAARGTCTTARR